MTRYLAVRLLGLLLLALAPVGCFESAAPNCTVSCAVDADCPSDLMCSSDGKCSTDGEVCVPIVNSCTAGEFLTCVGTQAQVCNQSGDGADLTECGAPGCNATAGRCNTCAPSELTCGAGDVLQSCSADGDAVTDVETCTLGCAPGDGAVAAHCRYLEPRYLPDICDTPATDPSETYASSSTLDTSIDSICSGGIVLQTGAPPICVIRAGTIAFTFGTITIRGSRIPAFVADGALDVMGIIDISADTGTNGPGGGTISGTVVAGTSGGGGAGFKTNGAPGGSTSGTGTGGAAGTTSDPAALVALTGGRRPANSMSISTPTSGGGGGALTLISCRGKVMISGLIDAGGGGGNGGQDVIGGSGISFVGGAGGGSGGYVVIQGGSVDVTNMARLFANGGGGGGATATNDAAAVDGQDGSRSATTAAAGGNDTSDGGSGGRIGAAPGPGQYVGGAGGGGGGSTGYFQIYVPSGVTPTVTPLEISPNFEANRTVMLR